MIEISLIEPTLRHLGKTKGGLATAMGLRNSAVTEIIQGDRKISADELPAVIEYLELDQVRVMGRIGAGGDIDPDLEQVPPEGLSTVRIALWVPDELVAFTVEGPSMKPRYDSGDVVVVWAQQRGMPQDYLGKEVAVRTKDGRRYLKTLMQGRTPTVYDLHSFNADPIEGVKLEWIGEIYSVIRAGQMARIVSRKHKIARKA